MKHQKENQFKLELKAIIQKGCYFAKHVANADKTSLFWKRLPSITYLAKTAKSSPGFKAAKGQLTLFLGGNAEGEFKFKPFLIYQSENPRAMKNVKQADLPGQWRANKKD